MRLELNALGINAPDGWIEAKVACYGPDRFERQVRWLPRRSACTLLILAAALRDDYEDPGRSRVAGPSAGPRVPRQVTRVGEGGLRKRELLAEIRRHGRAVVLKEMAEHHDRCRRGDTPDDVLSRQCEMMGFLTAATDEEIAARLTDTPAGKEPEQGPPGKGSHARRIPGVAAVPPPGEEADTRRGDY